MSALASKRKKLVPGTYFVEDDSCANPRLALFQRMHSRCKPALRVRRKVFSSSLSLQRRFSRSSLGQFFSTITVILSLNSNHFLSLTPQIHSLEHQFRVLSEAWSQSSDGPHRSELARHILELDVRISAAKYDLTQLVIGSPDQLHRHHSEPQPRTRHPTLMA